MAQPVTQQDTQPPAETLAEAQEIAIHFALPGMYDGISTHATRRGDANDKPYMRAILAALTRRAGGDAGSSHTPNAYILLEPDAEDVRLLAQGALAGCPCCGGTPSTFARLFPHSGIYQAYVNCSRCHVQVLSNARDRAEAREQAIAAWSRRPAPAGGDAGAVPSKRQVAYAYLKLRVSEKRDIAKAFGLPLPDTYYGQLEQEKAFLRSVFDAGRTTDLAAALALPAPVVEGGDTAAIRHIIRWIDEAMERAEKHGNTEGVWLFASQWRAVRNALFAALALPAPVVEGDPETVPGRVGWHTSEEGGGPDVGISVGLGNGSALWIGELLDRDGGPVGIVFHGPGGARHAARLTELDEVRDLFEHHVAPAIAALSEGRSHG